ncbi:DUF6230 family protein [Ornithinibacillus contaminans]|uniref:DUF6230 family protein n=1 Tax=Ornithinibacillus contaminans TaxID=694055 RepID=UPI00064D9632|nr:DUF6230 family protein [Ornithinibacillus contaminans]
MKEQKLIVGKTMKKKFFIAFAAGFLGFASLIAVFGFTGTAFALPLGGIGDFYVEFDELNGTEFQLLPHVGETGNSDAAAMVRNKMDKVEITNLHIYKDLELPGLGWVRFHVRASGPTNITGLIHDARLIEADLSFNELEILEQNTSEFAQNWSQNASTITIKDAKIVTDYLFQSVVSLDGAQISVEKISGPDMTTGK